ncbi:MAG: hypothetical protein ACLR06_14600 [Christensenellaceae bacterium]
MRGASGRGDGTGQKCRRHDALLRQPQISRGLVLPAWAESLGKNVTLDGKPCNVGQTPVKSLGVTDQHSQVQLYTEGPFDKVVTFLSLKKYACEMPIPHGCENIPDVAFLGGHTMQELIQAENEATAYALTKAGRMNYTLWIPELNAFTLGQLLFLFELQTAYAGAMLNIDTFNQPGVEEGKRRPSPCSAKRGTTPKKPNSTLNLRKTANISSDFLNKRKTRFPSGLKRPGGIFSKNARGLV